jgi:CubicO group peptidase (beta-lactamase class C family)
MRIKILSAILLTLALFNAISAQTPDKAKLDRFFDRLAEKNQAMGSLTVAKDGKVLYSPRHRLQPDQRQPEKACDHGEQIPGRLNYQNVHRLR